jgi:hypothetical protein
MLPKTPPPVQPALFQLMELAMDMVRKVSGVNDEILGLVGKEQAGVLEYQRKQAAYGILSPFFDAERRYRRDQGKLLLAQMRLYLPADKLMKVVDQGTQKYVTSPRRWRPAEYDVIVDDAPSGPNSKAKVMQVLGPWLCRWWRRASSTPNAIADILPYMDLPSAVADKLAAAIRGKAQVQMQMAPVIQKATQDKAAAELDVAHADAEHKRAQAFKAISAAHSDHQAIAKDFLVASQTAEQQEQQPDAAAAGSRPRPQPRPPTSPRTAMSESPDVAEEAARAEAMGDEGHETPLRPMAALRSSDRRRGRGSDEPARRTGRRSPRTRKRPSRQGAQRRRKAEA